MRETGVKKYVVQTVRVYAVFNVRTSLDDTVRRSNDIAKSLRLSSFSHQSEDQRRSASDIPNVHKGESHTTDLALHLFVITNLMTEMSLVSFSLTVRLMHEFLKGDYFHG